MSNPFYIQLDADGNPIGYPVMAQNLTELLGSEVTPESAKTLNYVPIAENAPTLTYSQTCNYIGWSKKEDGSFSMDYEIINFTQEQVVDLLVRGRRNFELANSDWTQLPDIALSAEEKAAWATYRQTLRDLPATYATAQKPEDITWPTRPNEPAFVAPPA